MQCVDAALAASRCVGAMRTERKRSVDARGGPQGAMEE